jgi:hypothetical protein
VIGGSLAQSVLGANVYAWWNSEIYSEVGYYWTPGRGFLRAMGVNPNEGIGVLSGTAPYFRLAYEKQFGDQNFDIGAFAFLPNLYPGGDQSTGKSDHYTDVGIDASLPVHGLRENIFQVNADLTHERQSWMRQPLGLVLQQLAERSSRGRLILLAKYAWWHRRILRHLGAPPIPSSTAATRR